MFTANIAGTAGSHLRSDFPHRDSNSHLNNPGLLDLDSETYTSATAEEKRYLSNRSQIEGEQPSADQVRRWLREYHFRKCLADYKSWGYMVCIASVILGGIILIILAATGVLSVSPGS